MLLVDASGVMGEEQKQSDSQTVSSKSIRLGLIVSEQSVSDYLTFLKHILVGLADESICVALVCPPDFDADSVVPLGVEVIKYPAIGLPLMGYWNQKILVERLVKFKPTILHCLCESNASLVRRLAKQLGLPYVLTVNSLQMRFGHLSISAKRCAKIIVPTKSIAASISKVHPRFGERIVQINVGTFAGTNSSCFCKPGQLISIMVAHDLDNIEYFKNLLGAIRHLAIGGYEFMLVVIGGGRAESRFRQLLHTLGLGQLVTIIPKPQSWRSFFAAADIFVQPQPDFAFNPLVLEAMSAGAVVAASKGRVDDLIIDGKTAIVFDADDELSIYGSLQQLFDRPELSRQLANQAQEYLRENHTVSKMVSSLLRVYRQSQDWFKHK